MIRLEMKIETLERYLFFREKRVSPGFSPVEYLEDNLIFPVSLDLVATGLLGCANDKEPACRCR